MSISFDMLSFFLTTIGLQVDGDFLCAHEAEYVTKRLQKFYEDNDEKVDNTQIIEYARTIISDIKYVLNHIRSTEWFAYGRDYVLFENESYKYRIGTDATIDLKQFGRNMNVPLTKYVNMKEFAYFGYTSSNIAVCDQFIDFPFSFPIDFDEYLSEFSQKQQKRENTDCEDSDEIIPQSKKICIDN